MTRNNGEQLIPFDRNERGDDHRLTLTYHYREVHVYQVTEEELQNLQDAGDHKTNDVALFGICATGCLSLFVTLLTVKIDNIYTFSSFVCVCAVFFLGALFTGFRIKSSNKASKKIITKITGNN